MPTLELTDDELRAFVTICMEMPWKIANPILTKAAKVQAESMTQPSQANSKRNERRVSDQP